jgi:hypothetical protein
MYIREQLSAFCISISINRGSCCKKSEMIKRWGVYLGEAPRYSQRAAQEDTSLEARKDSCIEHLFFLLSQYGLWFILKASLYHLSI